MEVLVYREDGDLWWELELEPLVDREIIRSGQQMRRSSCFRGRRLVTLLRYCVLLISGLAYSQVASWSRWYVSTAIQVGSSGVGT